MCPHWSHRPLTTKRLSSIVPHMALPAQASPARQVEVVYGSGPATHPAGPPTISIVVPAFNEEAGLGPTLAALRASMPKSVIEVIVVDDGSTDRTAAVAAEAGFRVVRHPNNRGYGAALKTGVREATGDYILTMDADGQHRMEDVATLCDAVSVPDPVECVIGHRQQLVHSPLWRMPGKTFLTLLAQVLIRRQIPDLNSGLRIARRDVALRYMHICPNGFSFSTTITMALMSRGFGVSFVPIRVAKRVGHSTVSARTGFEAILLVIRLATLFNPLRIFLPASAICILGGIAWGIPYLIARQGLTVASMLAILTGVLLFAVGLVCDQVSQLRLERFE
jgi:glycosyltransferase involved in cell wall biosynthesis